MLIGGGYKDHEFQKVEKTPKSTLKFIGLGAYTALDTSKLISIRYVTDPLGLI